MKSTSLGLGYAYTPRGSRDSDRAALKTQNVKADTFQDKGKHFRLLNESWGHDTARRVHYLTVKTGAALPAIQVAEINAMLGLPKLPDN